MRENLLLKSGMVMKKRCVCVRVCDRAGVDVGFEKQKMEVSLSSIIIIKISV